MDNKMFKCLDSCLQMRSQQKSSKFIRIFRFLYLLGGFKNNIILKLSQPKWGSLTCPSRWGDADDDDKVHHVDNVAGNQLVVEWHLLCGWSALSSTIIVIHGKISLDKINH